MSGLKWNKAHALAMAGDDAPLMEELLALFKDSLRSDLHHMEQGLVAGDSGTVYNAVHSIKGGAASLGIEPIATLAIAIEEESHAGGLDLAREHLPLLWTLLIELEEM